MKHNPGRIPRAFFWTLLTAVVALALPLAAMAAPAPDEPQPPADTIVLTRIASGLARPVFVTYAPGDRSRLFIIEKPGRNAGQLVGRSPWLQPVIVDETAGRIGDIVDVRITDTGANSLFAEAV